jgi:hypothetical protein
VDEKENCTKAEAGRQKTKAGDKTDLQPTPPADAAAQKAKRGSKRWVEILREILRAAAAAAAIVEKSRADRLTQ